ncbi:hypothetical protein I4U23_021309 [Adineta vaga]|nr:hypothetical protein I4U23_021309 [Adineta vaga]
MASTNVKSQEKEDVVLEEESGVIERRIDHISSSIQGKRPRYDQHSTEPPSKYRQHSNRNHIGMRTTVEQDVLSIPFWKHINRQQTFFQTREIGYFSLLNRADDKECFDDKRYLRVYKYPFQTLNVNFDLKIGEADFTTEGQTVVKFKNAYFLCEYVTESQVKEEEKMTPEHRAFCYYGHKFEEYVTKNHLSTETLNPSKQFSGVFQSTIGSYRLLYGAEMDCIIEHSSSTTEHIELKVCAGKTLDDLPFRYNRKFAKWWIQCFLVGIKNMVIGLRDNNGIVNTLCPLDIAHIERSADTWNRPSFFNFFLLFINYLQEHVTTDYALDRKDVVLFRFNPSSQKITVEKSTDSKYHFIPDWFSKEFL